MARSNIIITLLIVSILVTLPDVVFGFIGAVFHLLLELCHITFELVEQGLDTLVEHIFETNTHDTQLIVFYILMSFVAFIAYRIWRVLPRCYHYCTDTIVHFKTSRTEQLSNYWLHQNIMQKITLISGLFAFLFCLSFFVM